MALNMHTLKPAKGSTTKRWVVGRGHGTGIGKTSGRGMKGQTARSGVSGLKLKGFRHLMLSMPKSRGFKSLETKARALSLTDLARNFKANDKVTIGLLKEKGMMRKTQSEVKIVGGGELKFPLFVKGIPATKNAKEVIEKLGGKVS